MRWRRSTKGELYAVVYQPLAMSAFAGADLVEQRHGAFLEQPRPDAAENILRRLSLEDDVVDAIAMK